MWELQWGEEEKPTLLFLPKLCSGNAGPEDNLISVKARQLVAHAFDEAVHSGGILYQNGECRGHN